MSWRSGSRRETHRPCVVTGLAHLIVERDMQTSQSAPAASPTAAPVAAPAPVVITLPAAASVLTRRDIAALRERRGAFQSTCFSEPATIQSRQSAQWRSARSRPKRTGTEDRRARQSHRSTGVRYCEHGSAAHQRTRWTRCHDFGVVEAGVELRQHHGDLERLHHLRACSACVERRAHDLKAWQQDTDDAGLRRKRAQARPVTTGGGYNRDRGRASIRRPAIRHQTPF